MKGSLDDIDFVFMLFEGNAFLLSAKTKRSLL